MIRGNYRLALHFYEKSIEISQELINEKEESEAAALAKTFCHMGETYRMMKDYDKAIECQMKASKLTLRKKYRNKGERNVALGIVSLNLGMIYFDKNDYTNALHYYLEVKKYLEN